MSLSKTLTSKDLLSIEVGGAICLPVIMVGHQLAKSVGFLGAFLAILAGNAILFLLAMVSAAMSTARKKNTPDNAQDYLGTGGVKVLAAVLFTAKCCWFALQLNLMSMTIIHLLSPYLTESHFPLVNIVCGVFIACVTMLGIGGVSLLSSMSMPLLIGTMIYAVVGTKGQPISLGSVEWSYEAMAIVMAAAITAVIDMPTYFSRSRSKKDAIIAVVGMFLVALPAIELVGVYLSSVTQSDNILGIFMKPGNLLWNLWISLFVILAAWTTNTTNLFSASVCLGSLFDVRNHAVRCTITAGLAIGISLLDILGHFNTFLQMLVVIIGSIGAVILCSYCLNKPQEISLKIQAGNLVGALVGCTLGLCNVFHMMSISGVTIVDAFGAAFLVTAIANAKSKKPLLQGG